jgi:hypothetical protein
MKDKNKIALGVSFGFAGGAILGVVLGLLTKNFEVWLAVGVGTGIAIGSVIGWTKEHSTKVNRQLISGYIMALVGFILILRNATAYLFQLDNRPSAITIIGIVFFLIGLGNVRKHKR